MLLTILQEQTFFIIDFLPDMVYTNTLGGNMVKYSICYGNDNNLPLSSAFQINQEDK